MHGYDLSVTRSSSSDQISSFNGVPFGNVNMDSSDSFVPLMESDESSAD